MSRFKRAFYGVASSYALLAAMTCVTIVSIPLAFHYLSKEEFALWALMSTVGGYLALIDLGMSGSVARLLIDYKDDPRGGSYGGLIQTGALVLVTQGALLFCVCWLISPWLGELLDIQGGLKAEFVTLMRWQGVILGLSFWLRIFSHLLFAHQRIDIMNGAQAVSTILNLVLLWVCFGRGGGVLSIIWAGLGSHMLGAVIMAAGCWYLRLFPTSGGWGRASWPAFSELFFYGKDLFLVAVGGQVVLTSQTMIITRQLGLDAAAVWSVGTKAFNLLNQLIWKIYDSSAPGFAEMVARGEKGLAGDRYRVVLTLSASFAAFCAVSYALCNSLFVTVWTAGKISWAPSSSVLLGIWMVVLAILHCHNCLVTLTKHIGFMRYVYFVEGAVFVGAALVVARGSGLNAIILCSIFCSLVFSCAYGAWRVMRFFDLSLREIAWRWLMPMWIFLAMFTPLAALTWYATRPLPTVQRLIVHVLVCATAGVLLLVKYGRPPSFHAELLRRLPGGVARVLTWVQAPGVAWRKGVSVRSAKRSGP